MSNPSENLLRVPMFAGSEFNARNHIPLVAGCSASGQIYYVASHTTSAENDYYAICDGAGLDDILYESRSPDRKVTSFMLKRLDVYVLRFEPSMYESGDGKRGDDAVGPYAWRDVGTKDNVKPPLLTKS